MFKKYNNVYNFYIIAVIKNKAVKRRNKIIVIYFNIDIDTFAWDSGNEYQLNMGNIQAFYSVLYYNKFSVFGVESMICYFIGHRHLVSFHKFLFLYKTQFVHSQLLLLDTTLVEKGLLDTIDLNMSLFLFFMPLWKITNIGNAIIFQKRLCQSGVRGPEQ